MPFYHVLVIKMKRPLRFHSLDSLPKATQLFLGLSDDHKTTDHPLNHGLFGAPFANGMISPDRRRASELRTLAQLPSIFKSSYSSLPPIHLFPFDGPPLSPLSDTDQRLFSECERLIEECPPIGTSSFAAKGHEFGALFRSNPSAASLRDLVSLIRCGVMDVIGWKLSVVQCLSVCALMFHFIHHRPGLKGRIAQVATGEGKSIIIATFALAASLMGYFVDVITSTQYLARCDWKEF
jgi:hypothetical protein